MDGMEDTMEEMRALLKTTTNENEDLKKRLHTQSGEIEFLKNALNERESYARSWSMRVLNVPMHKDNENNTRVVMDTVYTALIRPILEGAKSKGEITSYPSCDNLLETAHILPGKPNSPKPIQVRFYSRYWRSLVFRHRREFAPRESTNTTSTPPEKKSRMRHPFFEDLTSATFNQLRSIKQHKGVTSAWTINGTIRFKVKNDETIYKVSSICQSVEDITNS